MTLQEWRKAKGWSRGHLANALNKKLPDRDTPIGDSHIQAWENGSMPGADVGEVIRKISKGHVVWGEQ